MQSEKLKKKQLKLQIDEQSPKEENCQIQSEIQLLNNPFDDSLINSNSTVSNSEKQKFHLRFKFLQGQRVASPVNSFFSSSSNSFFDHEKFQNNIRKNQIKDKKSVQSKNSISDLKLDQFSSKLRQKAQTSNDQKKRVEMKKYLVEKKDKIKKINLLYNQISNLWDQYQINNILRNLMDLEERQLFIDKIIKKRIQQEGTQEQMKLKQSAPLINKFVNKIGIKKKAVQTNQNSSSPQNSDGQIQQQDIVKNANSINLFFSAIKDRQKEKNQKNLKSENNSQKENLNNSLNKLESKRIDTIKEVQDTQQEDNQNNLDNTQNLQQVQNKNQQSKKTIYSSLNQSQPNLIQNEASASPKILITQRLSKYQRNSFSEKLLELNEQNKQSAQNQTKKQRNEILLSIDQDMIKNEQKRLNQGKISETSNKLIEQGRKIQKERINHNLSEHQRQNLASYFNSKLNLNQRKSFGGESGQANQKEINAELNTFIFEDEHLKKINKGYKFPLQAIDQVQKEVIEYYKRNLESVNDFLVTDYRLKSLDVKVLEKRIVDQILNQKEDNKLKVKKIQTKKPLSSQQKSLNQIEQDCLTDNSQILVSPQQNSQISFVNQISLSGALLQNQNQQELNKKQVSQKNILINEGKNIIYQNEQINQDKKIIPIKAKPKTSQESKYRIIRKTQSLDNFYQEKKLRYIIKSDKIQDEDDRSVELDNASFASYTETKLDALYKYGKELRQQNEQLGKMVYSSESRRRVDVQRPLQHQQDQNEKQLNFKQKELYKTSKDILMTIHQKIQPVDKNKSQK